MSEKSDEDSQPLGRPSRTREQLQYQDSLDAYQAQTQNENEEPNQQISAKKSGSRRSGSCKTSSAKMNKSKSEESLHRDHSVRIPQLNLERSPKSPVQLQNETAIIEGVSSLNYNDKPFPRQITSPQSYIAAGFVAGSPIRVRPGANTAGLGPSLSNVNRYLGIAHSNGPAAVTGRSGSGCGNAHYAPGQNLNDSVSTINQSHNSFSVYNVGSGLGPGQVTGVVGGTNPSPVHINELKREMRKKEQDFHKQTAVLKQQVQLLELQAKEFEQREGKLKRMHESMLKAVQEGSNQNGRQSLTSDQVLKEEFEETIGQQQSKMDTMKQEIKHFKFQQQNLTLQMEEKEIEQERKVQDLQLDKRNLENKIKRMENQISQARTSDQVVAQMSEKDQEIAKVKERMQQQQYQSKQEIEKLKTCNEEILRQKECQQKQIDFLQEQNEMKEQQKQTSLGRILQLEDQVKSYEMQVEEMEQQLDEMTQDIQQKEQSMQHLQQSLDFNSSFDLTGAARTNGATSGRSNLQIQRLADENEYLQVQIGSHQETIKNQQEQIVKYQNSENFHQNDLVKKQQENTKLQQQMDILSQQLNTVVEREHKTHIQEKDDLKAQLLQFKNQFEEAKNQHSRQLEERDHEIERLNSLLEKNNQKSMHQSPIRLQNMSTLVASRDFQLSLQGMQYIGGGNNLKPAHQNISQLSGMLPLGAHQAPLKSGPIPQDSTLDNSSQHFAKEECNNTLNLNTSHQFSQYRDQNFQTTGDSMNHMIYGQMGQQIMPGNLGIGVPMAGDDAFSHQLIDENGAPVGIYDLPRQQRPAAGNFSNSNIKIDFNNGGCTSASLLQNEETEEEKVQIPLSELDLLQSCQKIIDAASSMKCIQCSKFFQTTDFYDHIIVQKECVIESDQTSSENIVKPMLPNESNYFDELKKSQQNSDSMMKSMNQSKGFYDALNMPLQAKDVSNYQTYTNNQSKNHNEGQNKPLSSPFAENQSKVIQSDSKKSNNDYNQHYTRSNQKNFERDSKLKSKMVDIRSRSGGRGGHGSRSGMGCSGTAMTINSHILMSLSRSATSRSNLSEQQSPKQLGNDVNVNKNFHNDTDNIRNLAQNLKDFTDQNLITDENSFIQNSNEENNIKDDKLENAIGHDEKFNLMSCSDDNENDENQEQSQNNNDDDMLEEVNSLEEDNKMNSKKSYNDPSDPQNILSQSLRDIVNNQVDQNNYHHETNTNLNSQQITLQNSANQQNDNEIVEKLEKLYDLDTSRFEEEMLDFKEYSNLPSSKKKILLNRLETDKDNSSKNASRVQEYEGNNTSSVHNFVDISKFNLSHDLTKNLPEDKNAGNPVNLSQVSANSKGKAKIKVVGINLAPMLHKNNKSVLGLSMEERAERGKDLPLSINDSRRKLNGTALGGSGQNQINFFAKPSPKYQDDDITSGGMKALRGAAGDFSQLASHQGITSLRPSSSAAAMNTSKLSAFDHSQSSLNQKPKFDLSKQINEINQKKLAREKSKTKEKVTITDKKVSEVPTVGSSLKKAKSQSSLKHVIKKPVLNIEIEDNYYEEEENMNKPLQIEGLGLQVPGKDGTLQDQLASQKNVMESFRNYQNKMMQQTAGLGTADLNQQFQSVSSKNGTQNFDFGAITGGGSAQPKHGNSHGQQPSSRRHAHGTNRYNQNGFMMVTSSSLNSDQPADAQEQEQEVMQLPLQLQSHQSQISKSSLQVEPQKLLENQKGKPILSPAKPTSTGKYLEDKTIEQNVNLRQMSQKYSKRGQEMQRSGQLTDRRMDTSGVDINWGSELNSPLSKRMNIPQNQTKAMKNLRAGGRFLQIHEEDKSETDGLQGRESRLLGEEQDEIGDLLDFEKANAIEGAAGFQSHRHQLGKQVVGLKPTLMSKADSASYDLQATKRDPAMQTCSDKQLIELRKQLLNSQLSQPGRTDQNHQPPQLVSQGTVMTDELLQNYERERLLSVGSRGNFKLQTQQQVPQQHLQKVSPKNSDYIKQSILLQSGGKSKKLPANFRNRNSNFLEQEECPSFFDEFEFDEDHPIANQKVEIQQNFQSTAPQHSSKEMKLLNIEKQQQRPITQKNQATRKDPLKNSLFHSFMLTQRNKPDGTHGNAFMIAGSKKMGIGKSYLRSYRENAEDQMSLNQFKTNRSVFQNMHSSRSNQFSIIDNQYSTQNIHEHVDQPTILQGALPNSSAGPVNGGQSRPGTNMLQKHMIQTTALQRSRSNTKKQNIDQLAFNQSLGVINRPMMSNALHISQSNVMETSQNLSSRSGGAGGQNHQIQQSQIQSATKVYVEGPEPSMSQQQQSWSHGNALARKQSQQELVIGPKPNPLVQMKQ